MKLRFFKKPLKKTNIPGLFVYLTQEQKEKFNSWCQYHNLWYQDQMTGFIAILIGYFMMFFSLVLPFMLLSWFTGFIFSYITLFIFLGLYCIFIITTKKNRLKNSERIFGVSGFEDFLKELEKNK